MKKKIFFLIIFLVIVLLIGLPQINIAQFEQSTITSKFLVFTYSCLIIFGLYIIYISSYKLKTIYLSKIDIILSIIFGYISFNRYIIQPNISFSIPYMELLGLGVLYIILRDLSSKRFFWILLAITISGIMQALYGNLQLLGFYPSNHSLFKLTGSFFNPGPYAGFLTAVWPIALGMYLFKEKIIVQIQITSKYKITNRLISNIFEYIPLFGIISIVLVLPATQSRAAWLSTLISSLALIEIRYYVLKSFFKVVSYIKKSFLIIVSVGIFSIALFGLYHFKKNSANGRLLIWNVTIEMVKENPIFGVGFDRFKTHYMNYQADYFIKNGETAQAIVADNTYYTFNEWLQYTAENGLIGLLLLLLLLYVLYKVKVDIEYKFMYFLLSIGLLATGIFAFFSYPMQILPIKLIAIVLLAFIANLDTKKYLFFKKIQESKRAPLWLFKMMLLVFGVIGTTKGVKYTRTLELGFKTWKQALNRYKYGNYESSIEKCNEIYPIFRNNGEFLMNYGKALSMGKHNKQAVDILEESKRYLNTTVIETTLGDSYKALKLYDQAEIAYQNASSMIPSRFYPIYLLAKLYIENDKNEKALKMAKIILNKEIKIPSSAIKEMLEEMGEIEKKLAD